MIKRTFNLNDLFTLDTGFYGWCLDTIGEIIPNVLTTTSLQDNFTNYMLKPLWRKYQYVNANYDDSDSGRQQFKNDFANQLQDICVEFYTYVKANVKHFEGLDNKTDLIKQVSSVVAPINDIIDQTATDTALAKGTTAQNIGTTLYNDSVWLSMFNTYMTPQRKGEMLNRFAWLFLIAYYTGEKEEKEEYVLEVTDTLNMRSGDQVIEFDVDEEITGVVVTIEKPTTMIPRNIVSGVNIGGVIGSYEGIIPEGTIDITTNGEVDVSTYEKANVNVEGIVPTGTIELTENGDFYVGIYERANVNVPRPQLFAPVISLEGDILTISDDNNGDFVNTYRVLVDGVEKVGYNYTFSEIDLSTLELEDGTYTITIVATGIDFVDSVASNGVSYEVVGDPLQGTWVFNDILDLELFRFPEVSPRVNLNYSSNSTEYLQIILNFNGITYNTRTSGLANFIYQNNSWVDNNYKTIAITSTYDEISTNNQITKEEFLSWLQANATKQ